MPHFGLMDSKDSFKTEWGALLRARLHIRGGKRRLRQGKISSGLVTLYDALLFALRWYVASPLRRKTLGARGQEDFSDEKTIFTLIKNSAVIEVEFDYEAFDALIDRALIEEMPDYDYAPVLRDFEVFMTALGVMPFDEADLPPEDPATF